MHRLRLFLLPTALLCAGLRPEPIQDPAPAKPPDAGVHAFRIDGRTLLWDFTLRTLEGAKLEGAAVTGALILVDVNDRERAQRLPLESPALVRDGRRPSLTGQTRIAEDFGEGAYATALEWEAAGRRGSEKLGVTLVRHHGQYLSFLPRDVRFSAYPPEIAAWTDETKKAQRAAGTQLVAALLDAAKSKKREFKIPKGHYRLTLPPHRGGGKPCYVNLEDLADFTIDGGGSTIWLDSGAANGLRFHKCRHVTVKDLTIDYDPLPYAQGRVVAIDEERRKIRFTCDPGFEEALKSFSDFRGLLRFHAFYDDLEKGRAIKRNWTAGHTSNTPVTAIGGGLYESALRVRHPPASASGLEVGDAVALCPRSGGAALNLSSCDGMRIERVTIYAAGLDSVVDVYSGSTGGKGTVYDRLELRRRPNTRRLVCNNSAGIFVMQAGEGFTVADSIFEGSMDDSIAIQSFNALVVKTLSPMEHVIANRSGSVPMWLKAGSTITVVDLETLTPRGTTQIEKMEKYEEAGLAEREAARKRFAWGPEKFYRVTISKKLPLQELDMVLWDDVPSARDFRIENCYFHSGWARSMLVTGQRGTIRGNTIERSGRINIGPSTAWMIGTFAKEIVIEKNRLLEISASEADPEDGLPIRVGGGGEHAMNSTITIRDNEIRSCWFTGIAVRGVDGVTVSNNRLIEANLKPAKPAKDGLDLNKPIQILGCRNVVEKDNVVEPK